MIDTNKHLNCQMGIRFKQFRDRPHATAELYCLDHNAHIKWLSDADALELIDMGLPVDECVH